MSRLWDVLRAEPYGWIMVLVAALAMVATLPGRTHGLGMITERLLEDTTLELDPATSLTGASSAKEDLKAPSTAEESHKLRIARRRVAYADMNLWATLLGGLFCLPCGYLIDRYGLRLTLTVTVVGLGLAVVGMTNVTGWWSLFLLLMLTRGFGQSALSVISISMVGKWFSGRQSFPMALYSLTLSLGFALAPKLSEQYAEADWRVVWAGMGWILLLGMAPIALLLTRDPKPKLADFDANREQPGDQIGFTLLQAMQTPAFWVFGLSISVIALIGAGKSLFNESVLVQQGFDKKLFYSLMSLSFMVGLFVKIPVGWAGLYVPLNKLNAVGLLMLAGTLFWLPYIHTMPEIYAYSILGGISGTITTVLFFTIWGQAYGRKHLGQIQSVAQMMTVLASALGPKVYAECFARYNSYAPAFLVLAGTLAVLGVWSLVIRVPVPEEAPQVEPVPQLAAYAES